MQSKSFFYKLLDKYKRGQLLSGPLNMIGSKNPKLIYITAGIFCFILLLIANSFNSKNNQLQVAGSQGNTNQLKLKKPVIEGVKEAVDPRAIWSEEISSKVSKLDNKLDQTIEQTTSKQKEQLDLLKDEIGRLKDQLRNVKKESDNQLHLEPKEQVLLQPADTPKPAPKLVHLHQDFPDINKYDTENYVTSGSFARAVLLTGVVAETGTEAAGSPQPILLRLVDHGIFSKGYHTKQIKEAILIGSCYGNISSERALCRLQSLSLMNNSGDIVEKPVEGWLIGEDGRPGIKGDVIDKASDVTRMAVLNGILGGMANFFQSQATTSIYPVSPISGQANALAGKDALKAGAASGVGNALNKLADYAIKRAESMSPVIVVGSGRIIDVVFRKGFDLKLAQEQTSSSAISSPATSGSAQQNEAPANNQNDAFRQISQKLQQMKSGQQQGGY
jgi:conjugal transfer pilus assembly protein TraB